VRKAIFGRGIVVRGGGCFVAVVEFVPVTLVDAVGRDRLPVEWTVFANSAFLSEGLQGMGQGALIGW